MDYMAKAEAMCNRVAILVSGKLSWVPVLNPHLISPCYDQSKAGFTVEQEETWGKEWEVLLTHLKMIGVCGVCEVMKSQLEYISRLTSLVCLVNL
jgi:hypothetical protein